MASPDPLTKAKQLIEKLVRQGGSTATTARQAIALIDAAIAAGAGTNALQVERSSRRGSAVVEYAVEHATAGDALTERRLSGNSQPVRCPKTLYMALARALAEADRPLATDELLSAAQRFVGSPPPDFQARVPLRLWLNADPPLIQRNRARYAPLRRDAIIGEAQHLWQQLAEGKNR